MRDAVKRRRSPRVVIVGAGIGGLALARALRRQRFEVLVLERSERLAPVGAGISLAPNAMHALAVIEVAHEVAARGAPARSVAILNRAGEPLQDLPAEVVKSGVAIHRADLQKALATGQEHVGCGVVAVDTEGAAVTADGEVYEADLIVGADGIHSVARATLFPESVPVYAGYTAWRGIAPMSLEMGRWQEAWGRGARFGSLDIGGGRTYWFATKNAAEGEIDGGKAEILDRLEGWHRSAFKLVERTPDSSILRHDVYYLKPLRSWSRGKVTLLGDAAHATTPGIGQGAAQALEDALHLAHALPATDTLGEALTRYEAKRKPRTRMLSAMARRADRIAQASSPLLCFMRDRAAAAAPQRVQLRQYKTILDADLWWSPEAI